MIVIVKYTSLDAVESLNPIVDLPEEERTADQFEQDYADSMSDDSDESEDDEEHWELNDRIEDVIEDFNNDEINQESVNNSGIINTGILNITVLFLWLWASFYGISATALNHLIQYLHHFL